MLYHAAQGLANVRTLLQTGNAIFAGRTLYAVYPDGQGRSKLTTALIERTLQTRCTARNWNTVLKIAEAVR